MVENHLKLTKTEELAYEEELVSKLDALEEKINKKRKNLEKQF